MSCKKEYQIMKRYLYVLLCIILSGCSTLSVSKEEIKYQKIVTANLRRNWNEKRSIAKPIDPLIYNQSDCIKNHRGQSFQIIKPSFWSTTNFSETAIYCLDQKQYWILSSGTGCFDSSSNIYGPFEFENKNR